VQTSLKNERLKQKETVGQLGKQIKDLEAIIKQHAAKLLATETQRSAYSILDFQPETVISDRRSAIDDDNLSFEKLKRELVDLSFK
jgi:hypothetical protein